MCDVLHHVPERATWLSRLFEQMPSGSQLVLIEFNEGPLPEGPPETLKLSRDELVQLVDTAGFTLVSENTDLLPYKTLFVFETP